MRKRRNWKPVFAALNSLPEYKNKVLDIEHCAMLACSGMDEKEYIRLKQDAQRQYDEKMKAIEMVWEMSRQNALPSAPISIADLMREAINKLGEPFHLWQVRNQIEADHPEAKGRVKVNTISGHLTRMQRRGELEIVKKGYGTQPSSYRRKTQAVKQ